jgi:hypothetical protein
MQRYILVAVLVSAVMAGYVIAAVPNNALLKNAVNGVTSGHEEQLLAQAGQPGLSPQEQALINQIEADAAKLKADEAAERARGKPVNPQRRFIRDSLLHVADAARELENTTEHYHGHRADALRAMVQAHKQLMICYRIDS